MPVRKYKAAISGVHQARCTPPKPKQRHKAEPYVPVGGERRSK